MRGRDPSNRPTPPSFSSVIFDDDDNGQPPRTERRQGGPPDLEGDTVLLRVLGVIVALGLVIAVLVLPPISILDRGEEATPGGIETEARDELPALPEGLVALSALYDLRVPADIAGPVTLTVRLNEGAPSADNLAFYSFDGTEWRRLGAARAINEGASAEGVVDAIPSTIAVLQRTAFAQSLGLIVDAGQVPEPVASEGAIVSVLAARPVQAGPGESSIQFDVGGLDDARASGLSPYLGVSAAPGVESEAVNRLLADPALTTDHANAIVTIAQAEGVGGVHLDYPAIDPARRGAFTTFVQELSERLRGAGLSLVVSVPTPAATDTGAYDWVALSAAAEQLWLRGPADRSVYYERVQTGLEGRRAEGVDLRKVMLVIDRRSATLTPEGVQPVSLHDALALASTLRPRLDAGIAPGDAVTIEGVNIDVDANNTGLQWSDQARAVTFTYLDRGGARTVWLENRFSVAFRLDLARRFGLGGVVVEAAEQDSALPDIWNTVATFVEEGTVRLELPYGPYLTPRWDSSGGAIEGDTSRGVATWRAPDQPGVFDVTLVVSDGVVFVGQQLSLRVTEGGSLTEPVPASSDPGTAPAASDPEEVVPTTEAAATLEAPAAESTEEPTDTPDEPEETVEPTEVSADQATDATPEGDGPPGPAGN